MATSQTTEMQVEGEVSVDEAVKEILAEVEAEEQDPIEGMGNAQIAEIYHRMKPEDQRLFRQFKRFHKQYYETHRARCPKPPANSWHRTADVSRTAVRGC